MRARRTSCLVMMPTTFFPSTTGKQCTLCFNINLDACGQQRSAKTWLEFLNVISIELLKRQF